MTPVHVINESVPNTQLRIGHGTVGAAEAALDSISWPILKYIIIHAGAANGGTVTVGVPGSASAGWVLAAGESTPPIPVDNTNKLAIIGSAPGQAFNWFGI